MSERSTKYFRTPRDPSGKRATRYVRFDAHGTCATQHVANTRATTFAVTAAMLACATSSVNAHESRTINLGRGGYGISIGFHIEPTFPGKPNGVDFFTDVADPPFQGEKFRLLNRERGDTVDITLTPFRLKTDDIDSRDNGVVLRNMLEILPPLTDLQQCSFNTPDPLGLLDHCEALGYVAAFTPPKTGKLGVWGFYVNGTLKRKDHDGLHFEPVFVHETYVCERGTQDFVARAEHNYAVNGGFLGLFSCVRTKDNPGPGHRPAAGARVSPAPLQFRALSGGTVEED